MHVIPNEKDKRENEWSDQRLAAEQCCAKLANWLEDSIEAMEGKEDEDEYPRFTGNSGGEMLFNDYGFTGEFSDDEYWAPIWLDGTGEEPSVWNAVLKAFYAGARWQKKRVKTSEE